MRKLTAAILFFAVFVLAASPAHAARRPAPPRPGVLLNVRCVNSTTLRFTNWTVYEARVDLDNGPNVEIPAGIGRHVDVPRFDPYNGLETRWRAQFSNNVLLILPPGLFSTIRNWCRPL